MRRVFLTFIILIMTSGIASAGPFDLVAKSGMKGGEIAHIQLMLFSLGHHDSSIDGVFGHDTERSVKKFQKTQGMPEDGIITKKIMNRIKSQAAKHGSKEPAKFSRKMTVEATAYTTEDPGCGLYTFRGNRLRKGLIAVDPRVIPLGTKLYIPGYGYAVADDTGGAIKGNKIDLGYESRSEAFKFGRRTLTIYVL